MYRLLARLKQWYARHRELSRVEALRCKFRWLEEECMHSGEIELSSLVALAWEARRKGEHAHGLLCLLYRDRIEFVRPRVREIESELRLWP